MPNDMIKNTMVENNLYITSDINTETTNEVIIKLTQWVDTLPVLPQTNTKDTSPQNKPVLNIYINSYGGKFSILHPILTLMNIATAQGVIIKTYNLYHADSCASVIAISGTKGYRYMAENGYNLIHFGSRSMDCRQESEITNRTKFINHETFRFKEPYLLRTKISQNELDKYFEHEFSGFLTAEQCLRKGLCDWIITNDGRFINNIKDLKTR